MSLELSKTIKRETSSDDVEKEMSKLQAFLAKAFPSGSRQMIGCYAASEQRCAFSPGSRDLETTSKSDDDHCFINNGIFRNQKDMNFFTMYIFERRFGWSEHRPVLAYETHNANESITRQARRKSVLIETLDECLEWYVLQPRMHSSILQAFTYTFKKSTRLPVVRNQLITYLLEWLIFLAPGQEPLQEESFQELLNLLILGSTDVWSAIRNSCANALSAVVELLTISQIQAMFEALIKICSDKDSPWQAKDGCIKGIATIFGSFRWVLSAEVKSQSPSSQEKRTTEALWLKIGGHKFPCLPSFLTDPFESVVFRLLSHSQLSVRDHASKALSNFLARSNYEQIVKTFTQVMLLLGRVVESKGPHSKVLFLDAYVAEGLLGVAEFLIKRLVPDFILCNWDFCMRVFLHYLMHPASTVRQAASKIFKYLASKNCSEPRLLQILLLTLSHNWRTDLSIVLEVGMVKQLSALKSVLRKSESKGVLEASGVFYDGETLSEVWEWREGRMLAYELILKYLITNHIHYCFPSYYYFREGPLMQSSVDEKVFARMSRYSTENLSRSVRISSRKSERGHFYRRSLTTEHCGGISSRYITDMCRDLLQIITKSISPEKILGEREDKKYAKRPVSSQSLSALNRMVQFDKQAGIKNELCLKSSTGNLFVNDKATREENPLQGIEPLKDKPYSREMFETWCANYSTIGFNDILTQILVQTAECLASTQWELQRMAQQVLPLISEVFRFYDFERLKLIWRKADVHELSPLCYASYLGIKESVLHAARLKRNIAKSEWSKEGHQAQDSAERIISSVDHVLQESIEKIITLTKRPAFDKLSAIAMEILIHASVHFPAHIFDRSHEKDIVDGFLRLFVLAYPEDSYACHIRNAGDQAKMEVTCGGLLGFTFKQNLHSSIAKQVNEYVFSQVEKPMMQFVKSCPIDTVIISLESQFWDAPVETMYPLITIPFLPALIQVFGSSRQRNIDLHLIVQCCDMIIQDLKSLKNFTGYSTLYNVYVNASAEECLSILLKEDQDVYVLKHATEFLLDLIEICRQAVLLKNIFKAVAFQVSKMDIKVGKPASVAFNSCHADNQPARLQMLSNEIRQSPIEEQFGGDCSEEKDSEDDDNLFGSQALGLGENDGESSASNLKWRRMPSQDLSETQSDWDSWGSDQEDDSELKEILSLFLKRVQWLLEGSDLQEPSFVWELEACNPEVRRLISSLML